MKLLNQTRLKSRISAHGSLLEDLYRKSKELSNYLGLLDFNVSFPARSCELESVNVSRRVGNCKFLFPSFQSFSFCGYTV
ncbi:hypothetical protein Bca4012_025104 [Brassica carinata]